MQDLSSSSLVSALATPVSEFVRQVRQKLESSFPFGWISGEVSNLMRAGSGHIYFTLKDAGGQLRCAMWRSKAQLLPFQLTEGMQIEVRAQVTVYEARGDLQLSVDHIRRAGQGNLFEAYMRLKTRLEAEGLFANDLKRPLPTFPRCIGLVTSPAGAALHDVLITLQRRAPALAIILYPTLVQGEAAGEQIAQAILAASIRNPRDKVEALIICRGGGSLEDLWAFNNEAVVRAIRACAIPVISGVGHETDTTLTDFAADARAATPTAAAEIISAGLFDLRQRLPRVASELERSIARRLFQQGQKLDLLERSLIHPRERIARHHAALNQLSLRLRHAATQQRTLRQRRIQVLQTRLEHRSPDVAPCRLALDTLEARLDAAVRQNHARRLARLDTIASNLSHLNPQSVLQRGYAIVRDESGSVVRDAAKLRTGDELQLILGAGLAAVEVLSTSTLHDNPT